MQSSSNNRDHITKQHMLDTILQYLGTVPFDVERFTLIVQDHIHDKDIDVYLEALLYDYEQGDEVDEVEARGVLYNRAYPIFGEVFEQYYNNAYLREIIQYSEEEVQIKPQLEYVLQQPTRHAIKKGYIQQILHAFDSYDSSDARKSLVRGAQKILVEELIKNSTQIGQDDIMSV